MKTILVPTDFSEHAFYALKTAASIAKKTKAEIIIIHALLLPPSEYDENLYHGEYFEQVMSIADNKLNELINKSFLEGLKVSKHIETNMFLYEAVTQDKFNDVDLIVMGSHGKSGFSKVFIGSNTEKVVRMADSPVLTIKNEITDFKIRNIVFASNFYGESYEAFNKIKFFAELYNAHIDLLKVITVKDFEPTSVSRNLIADFAGHFNLADYSANIYNSLSVEKGIADYSDEVNADLIAIETHGRTGIAHLINGSLAEDVAVHEEKPVLSVKIKEPPVNKFGTSWYIDKIEKEGSSKSSNKAEKHYPKFSTI